MYDVCESGRKGRQYCSRRVCYIRTQECCVCVSAGRPLDQMIELRWTPLHESGSIKTRSLFRFIYDIKLEFFWSFFPSHQQLFLPVFTLIVCCMFNCSVCRLLTESEMCVESEMVSLVTFTQHRNSAEGNETISFVMSVCLSVRPHGTTRLSLDGFS